LSDSALSGSDTSPADLLETLARGLVSKPDDVIVEEVDDDDALVLELSVAEGDYGSVIGRGGRTANALRMLVKAAGTRQQQRVFVDIVDS